MSRYSRIVIGLSFSILMVLVAAGFFLRHLVRKSFPVTDGTLHVTGLHADVDVYRDRDGVPHIRAQDDHDLMVAAGYVQAQDRLWQMDLMRRAGEGRLSEILGTPTVDLDLLFRTLDLRGLAGRIRDQLHPGSREILEAYAEGVNDFIRSHEGKYPIEFDMLDYKPEPWKIEHSIIIGRVMAWELDRKSTRLNSSH